MNTGARRLPPYLLTIRVPWHVPLNRGPTTICGSLRITCEQIP